MAGEEPVQPQASALYDALQGMLNTRYMGKDVRAFTCIPSTNTEAASWAAQGGPEGALVVADYQTHGRGRMGRTWESATSKNLLFSLVLHPKLPPTHLGMITVAASLALVRSIDAFVSPLSPRIKWPNDILIHGRKCCGMLLETSYTPHQDVSHNHAILGIGININQERFDPAIADRSTSMLLETGRHTDRLALLCQFLQEFEDLYDVIGTEATETWMDQYESHMAFLGELITVRISGTAGYKSGIVRGITNTGALSLETSAGIEALHAGEVTTQGVPM